MITGPFDSLREYINTLEANDRLIRIKQMDQDKYEATGFAYRLVKEFGYDLAPAFLIEKIRINNHIKFKLLYDKSNSLIKKIKLEQLKKETT